MQRAKSVDAFIAQSTQWREELTRLRDILRAISLQKEIKWGAPYYTHNGKNVVGIGGSRPISDSGFIRAGVGLIAARAASIVIL